MDFISTKAAELEQVTMLTLDRRDARMGGARQQNGALRLLAGARNFNAENLMRRVTTMELKVTRRILFGLFNLEIYTSPILF